MRMRPPYCSFVTQECVLTISVSLSNITLLLKGTFLPLVTCLTRFPDCSSSDFVAVESFQLIYLIESEADKQKQSFQSAF